ncbi:hypothetical protein C8Q76DRAFT_254927 [Earliella scabrosa]|nr:hypothetical protein C8Q76DRAFT_254927 [Earliella scabrosa]
MFARLQVLSLSAPSPASASAHTASHPRFIKLSPHCLTAAPTSLPLYPLTSRSLYLTHTLTYNIDRPCIAVGVACNLYLLPISRVCLAPLRCQQSDVPYVDLYLSSCAVLVADGHVRLLHNAGECGVLA